MGIKGVQRSRYGPTQPIGVSLGADFGFHYLSARWKILRRLGRFRDRRRFMNAESTQRTICVAASHPPASPAIGQICLVISIQVHVQSEQEMHTNEDKG